MTEREMLAAIRRAYTQRIGDRWAYTLPQICATFGITAYRLTVIAKTWGLARYLTRRAA